MGCNECENREKQNMPESVPYIVYEGERVRSERHIKRLWIALIVLVAAIFATNAIWLWAWMQYDYVSYEYQQDGQGVNIIGDENEVKQNESTSEGEETNQEERQSESRSG